MITGSQDGPTMGEASVSVPGVPGVPGAPGAPGVPLTRRAFAADVMLRHLDAMAKRVEGVRAADDVEMVHKMRVATRRLRNALDLLGDVLADKALAKATKRIKAVTKALGRARDTDVQVLAVEAFLVDEKAGENRAHAAGVERLALRLGQRRRKLQPSVVKAMDRLESSGLIDELRQALLEIKVKARLRAAEAERDRPVDADAPVAAAPAIEADLLAGARSTIELRLEQMLAYEHYVHSPERVEELHAMRIAAKYVRYTMEAYGPLFAGGLRPHIKLVKTFQGLLGDLHDCDVWLDQLPRFIAAERRRHAEFFGHQRGFRRIERGVADFEADRRRLRDRVYRRFVAEWDAAESADRWQALRDSLSLAATPDTMQQTDREPAEAGDEDGGGTDVTASRSSTRDI